MIGLAAALVFQAVFDWVPRRGCNSEGKKEERPGDHNHQDFPKSTAIQNGRRTAMQMGGVLRVCPFPESVGAPKARQ